MERSPKTNTNFPIIVVQVKNSNGTTVRTFSIFINRSPHPLPVIYLYGTGVSDYTCHPNIHHLLYIIESTDSMIDSICRNSVDTQ